MIVMILCFFSLTSSMASNVYTSAKEISVLRAIGVTKGRIIFAYVTEAFVLVFAGCIIGVFVGMIIGTSMSMQRQLFT